MSERKTLFVDVILPLALGGNYTYRVPFEMNDLVKQGQRVIVQFGKNKLYSAIVKSVHEKVPSYSTKYIESVLDPSPVVNEKQLKLWDWMSFYYLCNPGEVMNAALPSGLKLSSETKVLINPDFGNDFSSLNDKEYLIAEALTIRNVLTLGDISQILDQRHVYPIVKQLLDKQVIIVQEEIKEKYKPRTETWVSLSEEYRNDDESLRKLFDQLEKKAYRQLESLMAFLNLAKDYKSGEAVRKTDITKTASAGIDGLVKKGIFITSEKEKGRVTDVASEGKDLGLSEDQSAALEKIREDFLNHDVSLLYGVTSSGKTELYVRLIMENLEKGKEVLFLLPEIALTSQLINRLRKFFGEKVGVYHSRFNEQERVEIWKSLLAGDKALHDYKIIIGARSSVFLPFNNLGLIIVDEEHDSSFKQHDPAPRYNARETAIYLSKLHGAKVLLGSATPSVESWYNAQQGKFGFARLEKRYGNVSLPAIDVVDLKEEQKKKKMKSHFSSVLLQEIESTLSRKEQVILFQNRRGFSPALECGTCAWVPHCTQCDVSLTFHKHIKLLRCHYCGYSAAPPSKCEACGEPEMKTRGFGTEKIEEELTLMFPEKKIARMDLDTTRARQSMNALIADFEDGKIDVLVGTQMVTKGLDFDNVGLVGVLNADSMLNFPDFRAYERSFQLMIQVAGRAGRRTGTGKVIIQSYNPAHFIIEKVLANDLEDFYRIELFERNNFHYPPFHRLIKITVKTKDQDLTDHAARSLADGLKEHFAERVLGPEYPIVARVRNEYLKSIMLKMEREASPIKTREYINAVISLFRARSEFKNVRLVVDVDPQ